MVKTKTKIIALLSVSFFLIQSIYIINANASIINDYVSVNPNDVVYTDTDILFSTSFYNDTIIKQSYDNASIEFMNFKNASIIDKTYLNISDNYENKGLGLSVLNASLIINQENKSIGVLDDNYDTFNDTRIIRQENRSVEVLGDFPATYSFNNEVGLENLEIPMIDGNSYNYDDDDLLIVESEFDNHSDVLHASDGGSDTRLSFYDSFTSQQNCSVEYWFQRNKSLGTSWMYIQGESGWITIFTMYTNTFVCQGKTIDTYNSFEWNHLRFEYFHSYFNVYINDVLNGHSPFNYSDGSVYGSGIRKVYFETVDTIDYYDAIQYSWNPIGNNRYSLPIDMINGTFDNSNNMNKNDNIYSNFTSTECISFSNEFIDSLDFTEGESILELSNTYVDDTNYIWLRDVDDSGVVNVEFVFDPIVGGRDFYISAHLFTTDSTSRSLNINGVSWKTTTTIDFDDELVEGVNSITFEAIGNQYVLTKFWYFKIIEKITPTLPELNFTMNLNCSEYNYSNFLALNITSYHFTNISQSISVNIYNYNTLSYDLMFTSSNIIETLNYYDDNTNIQQYFDDYGNLQLQFIGLDYSDTFVLFIDYIELIFYYNSEYTPNTYYLNRYISLNFNSYNFTSFLAMNITSYHFTNISQSISVNIYNYNTLSYDLMFESSHTSNTLHYFSNNTQIQDYIGLSGNMSFQYIGFNYDNSFQLLIDYFNVILYYNSEFTPNQYYVNKSFSNTFNKLNLTVLLSELYFYYQSSISLNIEFLAYNFTSKSFKTLAINSYISLTEIFLDNIDSFISENGTYLLTLYAITDKYFTFTIDTFNFFIWIPTYLNHTISFNEIGMYAYRFTIFWYNGTHNTNYTQEWISFSVILKPFLYYGLKIAFYVYIILMIIPITLMVLFSKWNKDNKPKLIKMYAKNSLILLGLFLLTMDSISIYFTIGNENESNFIFTLLNALIFGVFLNIVGVNGKGIFRKTTVKGGTILILTILALSGFGFFGFLFIFNFPLNALFFYDIFSTSTPHGIRFFISNILFFILILFFSFLTESEV